MARTHGGHDRHLENVSSELIQMSAGTTLAITSQSTDRVFSPRVAKVIAYLDRNGRLVYHGKKTS